MRGSKCCAFSPTPSARAAWPAGRPSTSKPSNKRLGEAALERMHRQKTGALIQASVLLGAISAGSPDVPERAALAEFGAEIGLAFQIQDDILDVEGTTTDARQTRRRRRRPRQADVSVGARPARNRATQALARRDRAIAALAPWGARFAALERIREFPGGARPAERFGLLLRPAPRVNFAAQCP